MDYRVQGAIVGALIAIVSGVIGAYTQHILSLRADRVRREMDRENERVMGKATTPSPTIEEQKMKVPEFMRSLATAIELDEFIAEIARIKRESEEPETGETEATQTELKQ